VLGEDNVFRYRPCRGVLVRGEPGAPGEALALAQVALAAVLCGTPLVLSASDVSPWPWLAEAPGIAVVVESPAELAARLSTSGAERLRAWRPVSRPLREAANEALVAVIEAPVLATGRLELRWYLREQAISRERHRYGNIMAPAGAE